jgi:hypothetical protein
MRQIVIVGLIGLVTIVPPSSARRSHVRAPSVEAASTQDRYCLQGTDWGYPGNCEFSSYEQCKASASGTADGCGENPQYLFARQREGYWPHR